MPDVRDIPLGKMAQAQQAALMRMQLYFTGATHKVIGGFADKARAIILENAGADGQLDGGEAYRTIQQLESAWKAAMDGWLKLFQATRKEGASLPFGRLAVEHEKMVKPAKVEEAKTSPVFEPQLRAVIEAANQRMYQDGLTLSSRIWKLDTESMEGIRQVLMQAMVDGKSAWQTAKDLEQFLGANQDCPRWTSTRLYKLTKKDIASGIRTGLKTGAECDGQGVAYKALRLARNEIQAAHHIATDRVIAAQPWVEKEQIMLSPAHPVKDICDDVVNGGEGGEGIYPVGEIILPLHPQCLCFKVTVRQDEKVFTDRLRSWMRGGSDAGLDRYAQTIGAPARQGIQRTLLNDVVAKALGVWLWGDEGDLVGRLE